MDLPFDIRHLQNLTSINVSHNKFQTLRFFHVVCQLTNLRILWANATGLTEIPVVEITKLTKLYVHTYNSIKIKVRICNCIINSWKLNIHVINTHRHTLGLRRNRITVLPVELMGLSSLWVFEINIFIMPGVITCRLFLIYFYICPGIPIFIRKWLTLDDNLIGEIPSDLSRITSRFINNFKMG